MVRFGLCWTVSYRLVDVVIIVIYAIVVTDEEAVVIIAFFIGFFRSPFSRD